MILDTELTISKVNVSHGKEEIWIQLVDKKSTIHFVETKISLEEFSRALFTLASRPCQTELRGLENVGKKHETKQIVVKFHNIKNQKDIQEAIAVHEKDGWKGRAEDVHHHNRVDQGNANKKEYYSITFHRWAEDLPKINDEGEKHE